MAGNHALAHHYLGRGGYNDRLPVFGSTIGAEVVVLQNFGGDQIITFVKDSQAALGRGVASKVIADDLTKRQL